MIFIPNSKSFKHQSEQNNEQHEYQQQPSYHQTNAFAEKESDTKCYETCTKLFAVLAVLALICGIGLLVYGGVQLQINSMIAGGVLLGSGSIFIIIAIVLYFKATSADNDNQLQHIKGPTVLRQRNKQYNLQNSHRHNQIDRSPTILFSSNQGRH